MDFRILGPLEVHDGDRDVPRGNELDDGAQGGYRQWHGDVGRDSDTAHQLRQHLQL